jgi:type I restriction enzyme S subunit
VKKAPIKEVSASRALWQFPLLRELSEGADAFADGPFGSNLKTEHYAPSGARVVRLQNIGLGEFLDRDKAFISLDHFRKLRRHEVRSGDVIVAALGDGARPAGRACRIPDEFGIGIVKADCFRVRLPAHVIDAHFLVSFFNSPTALAQFANDMRGATRPRVTLQMLKDTRIPLPPLAEQQRLATRLRKELDEAARARAALKAQLTAVEALPAAHLRAIFQNAEAQGWRVRKMGDFGEIVGGIQKQPNRVPVKFHKAFLTVRNVQHGALNLSRVERFEVTPAEFGRCRLQRGDLLIVEGNGSRDHIGRNALFNEDGEWIHQNHIIRVRLPPEPLSPEFVSHYLNSETGRAQLIEKARTTTGLYTLSTGKIASLEIPAPEPLKQAQIVASLNDEYAATHALRAALAAKLAEVEKLPATLLRAAFDAK